MYKLLILLIFLLQGCTYFVAKETIEVIDEALETSPNPEKKKKILEKQKIKIMLLLIENIIKVLNLILQNGNEVYLHQNGGELNEIYECNAI